MIETYIKFIYYLIPVALFILGYISGRLVERRHLRQLAERETALSNVFISDLKTIPPGGPGARSGWLVAGQAVIGTDYFIVMIGALRKLFGGTMTEYATLIDRARRESTLRMIEEARAGGADAVINIRYETTTIGGKGRPGGVEILAYGTAVVLS